MLKCLEAEHKMHNLDWMTAHGTTSWFMQLITCISVWSPGLCLVTITPLNLHTHSFIIDST